MKTQKPLKDLVPLINRQFHRHREQMQFELSLYEMHEGQVRGKVETALAGEILSKSAYRRAIQRIPSINIPKKVTDKLSKVYAEAPIRHTQNKADETGMAEFVRDMNLNAVMNHANRASNLNNRCAVEIYIQEGVHKLRILNAHQFFVVSDNPMDPTVPTIFVKLLGRRTELHQVQYDEQGRKITNEDDILLVDTFAVYTDTEFMIMDSNGHFRADLMKELGINSTVNPFGTIPFVYINKSPTELIPYPNQTAFDIGVLIPKLLTDLNYSAQFQSHSIIWAKNTDLDGAELNPDAVVNLGDSDREGGDPEIGTITPETDIDGVLKLIEFELSSYLSTVGIKAGSIGQLEAPSAASGVSKIMDESDATEARKEQTELFRIAENEFWAKFKVMQDIWVTQGAVENKYRFSENFVSTFAIKFAEIKPLESEKQKFEKMKIARELKLITKKQALREIYPNLSDEQIDRRIEELEEELSKEKDEMMSMGLTPGFSQLDRQQEGKSDEAIVEEEANGGAESE